MDRADVIIFGGGLVGLTLASALDSSGSTNPQALPRPTTLSTQTRWYRPERNFTT